jgi:membrane fusion protein, heavy metal efflux system
MNGMTEPASLPQAHAERHGSPKRRGVLIGVLALLAAAGVGLAVLAPHGAAPQAAPPSDVPRMENGQIHFSEAFRKRVGVQATPVQSAPLTPAVAAVGMVTFDPRYTERVGTRLRGVVRTLQVYEGAEVKKGDLLAEIDSPELGEAQAQVLMLRAQAIAADRHAERESALMAQALSTARQTDEAIAEKSRYDSMLRAAEQRVAALAGGPRPTRASDTLGVHKLMAPIDGTIVERNITPGELVEGDRMAFLISRLEHLWVELDVFEHNLSSIRVGDAVELSPLSGTKGDRISGRVAQVGAVIDPSTRSAPIRIEINNSERKLRPGQSVDAIIDAASAVTSRALLVPISAVTYVDGQPTVFVSTGSHSVVPTAVELGDTNGEKRQILKGLKEGQEVVIKGVFELKSELFR